jgi:hypothetical protein
MYGRDEKSMVQALREMARVSVDQSWGNKIAAAEKMKQWLSDDKRFSEYDLGKLVDRTMLSRYNGCSLDLTDPELRGLPARPLKLSNW